MRVRRLNVSADGPERPKPVTRHLYSVRRKQIGTVESHPHHTNRQEDSGDADLASVPTPRRSRPPQVPPSSIVRRCRYSSGSDPLDGARLPASPISEPRPSQQAPGDAELVFTPVIADSDRGLHPPVRSSLALAQLGAARVAPKVSLFFPATHGPFAPSTCSRDLTRSRHGVHHVKSQALVLLAANLLLPP